MVNKRYWKSFSDSINEIAKEIVEIEKKLENEGDSEIRLELEMRQLAKRRQVLSLKTKQERLKKEISIPVILEFNVQ